MAQSPSLAHGTRPGTGTAAGASPGIAAGIVEEAVAFQVAGKRLYGILHLPGPEAGIQSVVVMVLGGPQTRAGCHRAYVDIARKLCRRGHCLLRFDYEGLGDSEGPFVGYEYAAPSLRAALDFLRVRLPGVRRTYLWSLCDGSAASAVFSRFERERIDGMVLCNPFIHTAAGKAQTYLKHYYLKRLFEKEFLRKVARLDFDWKGSLASFFQQIRTARSSAPASDPSRSEGADRETPPERRGCFLEANVRPEVLRGIAGFGKPIHFLLSGNDLTAREFQDLVEADPRTAGLIAEKKIFLWPVKGADHTFSRAAFRDQVCDLTADALAGMGASPAAAGREELKP